eukprot:480965_1
MSSLLVLFLFIIQLWFNKADSKYSLNGDDWKITNPSYNTKATVPGSIYIDLLNAGIINEPYYGNNPSKTQWIANHSWTYTKIFNLSDSFLNNNIIQLITEGLDTKSNIYLNNKLIFVNDNMFHRNLISIKPLLNIGIINNITIVFVSKVKWALHEANSCNITQDQLCPTDCHHGFCDFNFIRTEPCSAGWDWGPSFASMGIWKDINLHAYNTAVIRDWLIYTYPINKNDYTNWNVTIIAYIDSGTTNVLHPKINTTTGSNNSTVITGKVLVLIPELNINKTVNIELNPYDEINVTIDIPFINNPQLWYPNNYGKQKLYSIKINFIDNTGQFDQGLSSKFAFRLIELQQPVAPGNHGKLFYFSVNGITIPIHGSNWIPMDAFQSHERINKTILEYRFIGLRDSYQNMIRNWGGGIYQSDEYYELADKYGIMIWEDMMFASDDYWMQSTFL